jgi:hypothetical protein
MDIQTAAKILGTNHTKDGDLKPMVKALELFSILNTEEENLRLEAAKFVLRRWEKYQEYCNESRNLKGKEHE